jgi:hypothetical protein
MFGVSVRLHYSIHKNLLELAKQSLLEIDTKLSWAILVNRFVPPLQFDGRFLDGYRVIYYLSKRFPIVDIGDELNLNTSYWRDNLRTIGWWNYLGPKFASRLPIDIFNRRRPSIGFIAGKHSTTNRRIAHAKQAVPSEIFYPPSRTEACLQKNHPRAWKQQTRRNNSRDLRHSLHTYHHSYLSMRRA